MKQNAIILCCLLLMAVGCKKVTVDFSYSPAEPKAGEKVTFTNNSSAGEKWDWNFGDNTVSTLKNPTKTYKKPGTYLVTLRVDSAKNKQYSRSITVYDTLPTFVASADSITHYTDVTLTANIYNPYSYALSYQWTLPAGCVLQSGTLTDKSIGVYFTVYNQAQTVDLTIYQGDKTYAVSRDLYIYETLAPAILMEQQDGTTLRQRLISTRLESVMPDASEESKALLAAACDTMVVYNDSVFYASRMQAVLGTAVQHIQLDKVERKWYFVTSNGLYVANINGAYPQAIDASATGALCVDNTRGKLYWAGADGLYAMSLVRSLNNRFNTTPERYNEVGNITKIAINDNLR